MSKLTDRIETKQLQRVAVCEPLNLTTVSEQIKLVDEYFMYALGFTLEVRGSALSHGPQLQYLKNNAKRQLIHEVYDEFRPGLRKLAVALHERKWEVAIHALHDLENEMFL